jgi:hypothetical protein
MLAEELGRPDRKALQVAKAEEHAPVHCRGFFVVLRITLGNNSATNIFWILRLYALQTQYLSHYWPRVTV